jgi:phosphoenolpyruvate phosphomutase
MIDQPHGPPAAQHLRALWAQPRVLRVAGAHDAVGAQLAIEAGCDAVWSSGLEVSTAHGVPDASILTMTEYLAAARTMAAAIAPAPVIADCDTGYGNSNNVARMVREFESAGIAAVCIEDKLFPKVNSFVGQRQELASVAEFVGKLLAAKHAQRTEHFAVIARTEALIAGRGVDEALRRADAYVRAGADALLVHDKSPDAHLLFEFLAQWQGTVPVVVVPTMFPQVHVDEFARRGVSTVIYANHGLRASARALEQLWRQVLDDGCTAAVESTIAPLSTVFRLQGMPALEAAESAFLRSGPTPTRAVILSAGSHLDDASLAPLTADVPLAALDVNGAPLIARQVTALREVGITDVTVVAGYRAAAVDVAHAQVIVNDTWASGGEVSSLLCGTATPAAPEVRTLVLYGDVLVDTALLLRLLSTDDDCVAVVDRNGAAQHRRGHTPRDHVIVADGQAAGPRFLAPSAPRPVTAIGAAVTAAAANGEFAGVLLVREPRWTALRQHATSLGAGALPDLLAAEIAAGRSVSALEVTSGWLEIRSFADYEFACRQVAR